MNIISRVVGVSLTIIFCVSLTITLCWTLVVRLTCPFSDCLVYLLAYKNSNNFLASFFLWYTKGNRLDITVYSLPFVKFYQLT